MLGSKHLFEYALNNMILNTYCIFNSLSFSIIFCPFHFFQPPLHELIIPLCEIPLLKSQNIGYRQLKVPKNKGGNILFNNALNTFYLRLYGIRHMVKDHSDSKRGNPLPPHRLLFPISSKGSFICTIPQTG